MQLEQHIFSLYRILLRIPKTIFIILTALFFAAAVMHIQYIYSTQLKLQDALSNSNSTLSKCLIEYALAKHQSKVENSQSSNNQSQTKNMSQSMTRVIFLEQATILHIRIGSNQEYTYNLNYNYSYGKDPLPLFVITDIQPLQSIRTNNQNYLRSHGITFDLITIPHINIEPPAFSFYFNQRMLLNELIMQYLRDSIISIDQEFIKYNYLNNITNTTLNYSPLQLNFYYHIINQYDDTNEDYYDSSLNLKSFITMKMLPIFFQKLYLSFILFLILMIISILIGLIVRYIIILLFTIFLLIADKCLRQSWGWTHQYLIILYNRYRVNPFSTFKIFAFYIISNVSIYAFFIFGAYCIIKKIIYPSIFLLIDQYKLVYLKIFFFIELFHFIFSRSRVTIKFFPIISFCINFSIILISSINRTGFAIILLNINMFLQLATFFSFMTIEKIIIDGNQKGLMNQFCPSISKPRMLFYAGYDISWEKSLPPLWTYFTKWFDYSYFNDNEKCLLEKDYQLLYGRMLGLNQRQEIPEEQNELIQDQINGRQPPSFQMNLIQD